MSRVDVVIPCYNYAHYLEFCVGTVLSQRDVDVRVLIVDDVSPDDTPAVAARLVEADARVSYVRNERNLGLVGSANRGVMDWAEADYTLLLSADDAITPGALARAAKVMDAHPEVGMTCGWSLVAAENEAIRSVEDQSEFEYRIVEGADFIRSCCTNWCSVASPSALVRTSLQHRIGGLHESFPHTCDVEIWMRIATQASICTINAVQAFYRRHESNMSNSYMNSRVGDLPIQLATVESVLEHWGRDMPGADEWRQALKKRLIALAFWMAGLAFERGDDDAMKACLDFAAQLDPASWRSVPGLRVLAKRAVGRNAMKAFRGLKGEVTWKPSPFKTGKLFGWWPETPVVGQMRA